MSVNVELKTSCALTPYYSLELNLLSSTSHLLTPRSAHNWFAASAERKLILEVQKSMNPKVFGCFSRFSNFSYFGWFYDDFIIKFMFSNVFCFQGKVPHRFWMEWQGKQDMLKLTPRQHMSYVQSSCIVCSLFSSIQNLKLRCQIPLTYI